MDLRVSYSNGVVSPQIFLGTYRIKSDSEVWTAVETAVSLGYRGLDTASVYKNHRKIADTLRSWLARMRDKEDRILVSLEERIRFS